MIDDRVVGMNEVRKWAQRRGPETALVMGGGPSIEEDFQAVMDHEADAVLIAVKQHAMIYLAAAEGITAEVCCFLEDPDTPGQEGLRTALLMSPTTWQVSPFDKWSNVRIDEPWWNGGFSSSLAVWFACAAGFERVLLAGMDCYQGDRKYWYDRPGYHHPCFDFPLKNHLSAWRPAVSDRGVGVSWFDGKHYPCVGPVINSERIKAVSGPLVEVFGRWIP